MEKKRINWKLNLAFIWMAEICSRAGFSMAIPFIPFYMRDRYMLSDGDVKTSVMMFGLAGSLALFFSFPLWGMVGDRMGRRLMLLRAMFCSGVLYASFMFAPAVGILILLRFITGFFSGTVSPAQALVVTTTPEDHHGFALGMLSSSVWGGNVLGMILGGLVVKYGSYNAFWQWVFRFAHFDPQGTVVKLWSYNMAFALTMILFLVAGIIVLFLVKENFTPPPKKPKAEKGTGSFVWPFAGFGCAVYAILGMFLWMSFANRCDEHYLSLLVEVVGKVKGKGVADLVGMIGAAAAFGTVSAAVIVGFFSDKVSPRRIILPIAVIGAAAMICQAFSVNGRMLGAARFVTFLAIGGLEPTVLGLLSRESPKEKRGTIFGCVASLRIMGLMLGSFTGWLVMKLVDFLLRDGTTVFGQPPYNVGIRCIPLVGATALLLLIPWIFFVERMVARRHAQLEAQKRFFSEDGCR